MKARSPNSRTVALGVKFSKTEADVLRRSASNSGMTVSSLLHALAIRGKVQPRPKIDPIAVDQWRALAPIAANLNQLARRINEGRSDEPADVADELLALRCVLEEIRNRLIGEEQAAA